MESEPDFEYSDCLDAQCGNIIIRPKVEFS